MKQKAVIIGLALFTLWPLAHLALVATYDVSAWKLCGWGMYSTPRFDMVGMEVYGRGATTGASEQLTTPSPAVRALATSFLESYRWLRALATRDDLTHALLAEHPEWDQVRLVVFRPSMDPTAGMITLLRAEYFQPRRPPR